MEEIEFVKHYIPKHKIWLNPPLISKLIGRSQNFVRTEIENGNMLGHILKTQLENGECKSYYQVPREGLILYLLKTASFSTPDYIKNMREVLSNASVDKLKIIRKLVDEKLKI